MTVHCDYGSGRFLAMLAWVGFCTVVACVWLGTLGFALCVPATRWLRELSTRSPLSLRLGNGLGEVTAIEVWVLPWVLWIRTTGGAHWMWRDEMTAREWAGIRRYLRIHLPSQPLGLTISS